MNSNNDENEGIKPEAYGYKAIKYYREFNTPKVVKLVMKWLGGTITERRANHLLFVFVVLAIAVSLYLFFGGKPTQQRLTSLQLEQMRNMMPLPPAR